MESVKDLTGQKFGRLTVLSCRRNGKKNTCYCQCDCGNTVFVCRYDILGGKTKSCGCLRREVTATKRKKHGMSNSRLYRIWNAMKERCQCNTNIQYNDYGARGIAVCDEWKDDFQAFHDWAISNGYNENLTIDRIDNDGNYCPENCKWATRKEQNFNKRNNRIITHNGKSQTLQQWSEETGIECTTLLYRIKHGWTLEAALTVPPYFTRKNKELDVYLK